MIERNPTLMERTSDSGIQYQNPHAKFKKLVNWAI